MKYKIGDRVLFTFLGEHLEGTIIEKIDAFKWKVLGDNGTRYPFVYKKKPNSKEKVLSYIVEKL